jgi:ABC-type transporter Mla maintaining outer membrane lipid asymmetry ATPase subunit MlaF
LKIVRDDDGRQGMFFLQPKNQIVVTHDLQSAKTIADSVALLDKGKVVMQGSFKQLSESNDDLVREFFKRDS